MLGGEIRELGTRKSNQNLGWESNQKSNSSVKEEVSRQKP